MNKKGFTLVELLATILILAIVVSIAGYSIINIIKSSKNENYKQLINNIKDAAEVYYEECRYSKETLYPAFNNNTSAVNTFCNGTVSLGDLVKYGFLKGNEKGNNNTYTIVNPNDNKSIKDCTINVSYNSTTGKLTVSKVSGNSSCPSSY